MKSKNLKKINLGVIIVFLTIVFSCEKEDDSTNLSNKVKITELSVSNISYQTAQISSKIPENYKLDIEEYGHCWSLDSDPDLNDSTNVFIGYSSNTFITDLSGLKHNSTYNVRAYFKIGDIINYSKVISFRTLEIKVPTVTTKAYSNLKAKTVESGGEVLNDNGSEIISRGVCWSKSENPLISDSVTIDSLGVGVFMSNPKNLEINTTYFLRAYATNEIGTGYGDVIHFTTKDGVIEIITNDITEITKSSAVSGGVIIDAEGLEIIEKGICWNTSNTPTISDQKNNNGVGDIVFTNNLTGLSSSTTYFVRAYLINEVGISYGNEVTFTSSDGKPILNTIDLSEITLNSLLTGGEIITDNGSVITEKGVCWNTIGSPTISDFKKSEGSGSENFTSYINNLTEGEVYYIRAYAINAVGISYGKELSIELNADNISVQDYDGNWYNTVKIGDQIWLKQNLRTTHFSNGIQINNGDGIDINSESAPVYYFNYDNNPANAEIYGRLYTWYAATEACPDGWHMATKADWDELFSYIGIEKASALKSSGTIEGGTGLWYSPNIGGTDEFGFSALPSGFYSAQFYQYVDLGHSCSYVYADDGQSGMVLKYDLNGISGLGTGLKFGHTVRCIKD